MSRKLRYNMHFGQSAIIGLLLAACHNRSAPTVTPEKHLVLLTRPGNALYVDRVDNRMVMQPDSATQKNFCSFRIGISDSSSGTAGTLVADRRNLIEKERYFQYTMQNDWKALAGGDTLLAVFFQEKPGLSSLVKEGVIVFETPSGRKPDTLIYRDSFGAWGTQILSLTENK